MSGGSVEGAPGRKAQWFDDAQAQLEAWPEVKAVSYFNVDANCDWLVDSSPSSLSAYRGMGADPYFNPATTPPKDTGVSAYVDVSDFLFGPPAGGPAQGESVEWLFRGPSKHTVTDTSGMDYFDSGSQSEGKTFSFPFIAAGKYPYECTIHPDMTGYVKVPVIVSPTSGNVATTFTITWASTAAPSDYEYDVQIERPGESTYSTWKSDQTVRKATFDPDSGPGTYWFRARIRQVSSGEDSWYSVGASIIVSH